MLRRAIVAAICSLLSLTAPMVASARERAVANDAKSIVLPFRLNKDGFPLIRGKIDNTVGSFLFDTGNAMRFLLNRNYVPLDTGVEVGRGNFASGQVVVVRTHQGSHIASVADVFTGPASSGSRKAPEATMSIDARQQQQNIDGQLLGWIGWGFFKEYVTTIDYMAMTIRLDPLGTTSKIDGETAVVVIPFTPSSPVIPFYVEVDGVSIPAIVDTAGRDQLALSAARWKEVQATRRLRNGPGAQCISIDGASLAGARIDLIDLERVEQGEERLTLGIDFLRRFTSRWDPLAGTVTLFDNGAPRPAPKPSCT